MLSRFGSISPTRPTIWSIGMSRAPGIAQISCSHGSRTSRIAVASPESSRRFSSDGAISAKGSTRPECTPHPDSRQVGTRARWRRASRVDDVQSDSWKPPATARVAVDTHLGRDMPREPISVGPVRFPAGYGTPGGADSLIVWRSVEERLRTAGNYWIATVGPNARPHARPVDGVWVEGALCF